MEVYSLPNYVQGKMKEEGTTYVLSENKRGKVVSRVPSSEEVYQTIRGLKETQKSLENKYTIRELAEVIDSGGGSFFNTDRHQDVLSILEITTGRSREVLKEDLDKLREFMSKKYLDKMIEDSEGDYKGIFDRPVSKFTDLVYRQRKPLGVVFHHLAGNSPMVTTSLVLGALTKNASIAKTGSGDPATSLYLADAINEADKQVGKSMAVFYWPAKVDGSLNDIYSVIFPTDPTECLIDGVACWGDEESVSTIKKLANHAGIKIIEHGPKYSLDVLLEVPRDGDAEKIFYNLLKDSVVSHDQGACISTRVVFVVGRDGKKVAEALNNTFGRIEEEYPNKSMSVGEVIGKRLQYVGNKGVEIYTPPRNKPAWTVVYLPKDTELSLADVNACMNRFLIVKEVENLNEITEFIEKSNLKRYMQVCGVYPPEKLNETEITDALWRAGFSKLSPVGEHSVFYPGASHDGMNDLVEFTKYVSADKHNFFTKLMKKLFL